MVKKIKVKRIYEKVEKNDSFRVLVERSCIKGNVSELNDMKPNGIAKKY
jgi:uncharacterized protein YeaO (DUF488 family)